MRVILPDIGRPCRQLCCLPWLTRSAQPAHPTAAGTVREISGTIARVLADAVPSEGDCLDANVDFSAKAGYFVRVDVELPQDAVSRIQRDDGGPTGWLRLTPEDAEELAAKLVAAASGVRAQEKQ